MDIDTIRAYFSMGHHKACIEAVLKANSCGLSRIESIEAWSLCALSYGGLGSYGEAIKCLKEALRLDSLEGGHHALSLSINLAEFYRRSNKTLQAIALLRGLLPCKDANLHFNLARCYADLEDYEQSIEHYTQSLKLNPGDLEAIFNLANQQAALGRLGMALKYYALAYEGGKGDAGLNLAQIQVKLDELDPALRLYEELEPSYARDANFYFNYGNALRFASQHKRALEAYTRALCLNEDLRYAVNLSHLLLSIGEIRRGFEFYEYRRGMLGASSFNTQSPDRHFLDFGLRDRRAILSFIKDKKVLLYHEQGFGDSLMFARFIPLLKCKSKILAMPGPLHRLFAGFGLPLVDRYDAADYEVALPLPSLGFLLATSWNLKQSLGNLNSLLTKHLAKAPKFQCLATKDSKAGLRVGINFSSNPNFQYAREKSIYPRRLLEALPQEGVTYINLQYEGMDTWLAAQYGVYDASGDIGDFYDSALLLKELDVVISIDSALAHLSASLGVETLVLLHKRHDWRWGAIGDTKASPWYGDAKLFIQKALGNWDWPLENLGAYLRAKLESRLPRLSRAGDYQGAR